MSGAKKTITRDQYLMLVGLSTLAHYHHKALSDIERSACALTGDEPNSNTRTKDFIFYDAPISAAGVDTLLDKLGIEVVEP